MIAQISKPHPTRRTSSDSVWPLRRPDGTKLCERPIVERDRARTHEGRSDA
jgi:hypothetical protein